MLNFTPTESQKQHTRIRNTWERRKQKKQLSGSHEGSVRPKRSWIWHINKIIDILDISFYPFFI